MCWKTNSKWSLNGEFLNYFCQEKEMFSALFILSEENPLSTIGFLSQGQWNGALMPARTSCWTDHIYDLTITLIEGISYNQNDNHINQIIRMRILLHHGTTTIYVVRTCWSQRCVGRRVDFTNHDLRSQNQKIFISDLNFNLRIMSIFLSWLSVCVCVVFILKQD